ncbi:MAG: hypothetical protein GY774_33255 [Planctomycetes bacterium]|nr:hypothetical protein [Planctomycetota bacterium]
MLAITTITGLLALINLQSLPFLLEGQLGTISISVSPTEEPLKEEYFVVIGIPSLASHSAERAAIRETWLNVSRWKVLRDVEEQYKLIKVMFTFGQMKREEYNGDFLREVAEHDDMYIIEGLEEGRVALKYKVLWSFEQSLRQFNYQYFVKTDDDIFLNLPLMLWSLMTSGTRLYTGSCSHEYGGFQEYPIWRYCSGGGYVLSRDVVQEIQRLPPRVHRPHLKPEDAYTGWLVFKLNTVRNYTVETASLGLLRWVPYTCGRYKNNVWFYHFVRPDMMEDLFNGINNNVYKSCSNNSENP